MIQLDRGALSGTASDFHARIVPRCFPGRSPFGGSEQAGIAAAAPLLSGLSDRAAEGIAGLLPAMVCGEESAVIVFDQERLRIRGDLFVDSNAALKRIANEEAGHETLLRSLASLLPQPKNEASIRRKAQRYFAGLHTDDLGSHFARIAWLDSGVCIILSEVVRASLTGAPRLRAALRSIMQDEARHVAFSRHYSTHLGVRSESNRESFSLVRCGLIELLQPCTAAIEHLDIDPDRLFARLRRPGPLREFT